MGKVLGRTSLGQVWDKCGTRWGQVGDKLETFSRYVLNLFQIYLGLVFDIIKQIWDKFSTCLGQVWEVVYDWLRVYCEFNIKKPLTHGQQALKYDAFED